jgi:hypothetical protein
MERVCDRYEKMEGYCSTGQSPQRAVVPMEKKNRKTRYPLYRRLGGPQGRSGQVRKISPPPGFDPRTAQPVARRCTDYAIPAHYI